jgi:RNA polymerase sigma factor (sigma-70 family)
VWRIALRAALEARGERELPVDEVLDPRLVAPERNPSLTAALATLPPRRRLIVFLRYFGDFSYAEIATACDVSEGTVAATLAQAHEALARTLEPEGALG